MSNSMYPLDEKVNYNNGLHAPFVEFSNWESSLEKDLCKFYVPLCPGGLVGNDEITLVTYPFVELKQSQEKFSHCVNFQKGSKVVISFLYHPWISILFQNFQ